MISAVKNKIFHYLWSIALLFAFSYNFNAYAIKPVTEWAKRIGGNQGDESGDITHDANGNVYVTGLIHGPVNFDPGGSDFTLSSTGPGGFISKYDPDGRFVWAKRIGEQGYSYGRVLKADDFGHLYIAGGMGEETKFDPGAPTLGPGGMYILKLDTAGNFIWAKNLSPNGFMVPNAIDIDPYGNIYATGEFSGTLAINLPGSQVNVTSNGLNDIFVVKLDSTGEVTWVKGFGGGNVDNAYSIAVDGSGNVYTTGAYSGTLDFNPDPNEDFKITASTSGTNREAFISKLDAAGNFVWAKTFAGRGEGNGITVGTCGNIYATGYFNGPVDFDPGPLQELITGSYSLYVANLDTAGNVLWVKSIGRNIFPFSMETDQQSNVYVTGRFNASRMNFNPGQGASDTFYLSSVKWDDAFILKLNAAGNFAWATSFGSEAADAGRALSIDKNNYVHATGIFQLDLISDTAFNKFSLKSSGAYDIYTMKMKQVCPDTSSSIMNLKLCDDHFTLNCRDYTESGTYTQVFQNTRGCDSLLTLILSLGSIEKPEITVHADFQLGTHLSYHTYQWFSNGRIMAGETDSVLLVTENGDYYVVVTTENGCIDTSDIYKVTNVSIIPPADHSPSLKLYPNPSQSVVYIKSSGIVDIILTDITGKEIRSVKKATVIPVSDLAEGIYGLRIYDQQGRLISVEKVIKMK